MPKRLLLCVAVVLCAAVAPVSARAHPADGARTNATYFNNAALPAADPYVLHDKRSGYYYAYSTDGADPGYYFGVYRSADLATWEKVPGGALPVNDPNQWGNDWFWAPEVYFNPRTRLYYMFYAARSDANKANWFGYADFEEPSKTGVAVSRSPAGPFHNIANRPDRLQPLRPRLPRRQPHHGARPEEAAGHAGGGGDGAAGHLHPVHRSGRLLRLRRADVPVLLAQRLSQLGLGHRPGQVHRGVQHLRGRDHQRLVERSARADDADDRAGLPGGQRVAGRTAGAAPRRLGADPRLRPRQAGVGERRRQRLRGHRRREEGPSLGGGLEHAEDLRARRPPGLLPHLLGQQLGDAAVRRRLRDGEQPARPVHEVPDQPDPESERVDRDVLHRARQLLRLARLAGALLRAPRPAIADRAAAAPLHRARVPRSGLAGAEHRPGDERPPDPVGGRAVLDRAPLRARCTCAPVPRGGSHGGSGAPIAPCSPSATR